MSTITDPNTGNGASEVSDGESTRSLSAPVRLVGFWTAVALPFLYVPLLVNGLDTAGQRQTFCLLLALNAVALYVGHRYRRED